MLNKYYRVKCTVSFLPTTHTVLLLLPRSSLTVRNELMLFWFAVASFQPRRLCSCFCTSAHWHNSCGSAHPPAPYVLKSLQGGAAKAGANVARWRHLVICIPVIHPHVQWHGDKISNKGTWRRCSLRIDYCLLLKYCHLFLTERTHLL